MRSPVALLLTSLFSLGALHAASWNEADSLLHAWHRKHPNDDAQAYQEAGDSIRATQGDCAAQLFGANLLLRGWAMNPKSRPTNWRERILLPEGCHPVSARYHYQYAVMEYLDEAWSQAVNHFNTARNTSRDSLFRQECHTSLAACFDKLTGQRDSVIWHLEAALRWGPTSPYLLNNIAGAYLDELQGDRALPFILRALDQDELPENLAFNLTLNLLNAYRITGQMEEAAEVYDSLKRMEITAGNRIPFVRSLAEYLLASNRYDEYRAVHDELTDLLAGEPLTEGAIQWLFQPGRALLGDTLISPLSKAQWATIRWACQQPPPPAAQSEPLQDAPAPEAPTSRAFPIIASILLFLAGVGMGRISLTKRSKPAATSNVKHPIIAELLSQIEAQEDEEAIVRNLHKLDGLWQVKHKSTYRTIQPTEGLSMIEDQVLELIASGRTSKEIAQVLDLSVSYVYNVRARLRKKLNVPDELLLEQWIHESTS
jgi:DNA-binding CsgD family transcriptional regulator/tetratricopeptide (TPR) repeat protein